MHFEQFQRITENRCENNGNDNYIYIIPICTQDRIGFSDVRTKQKQNE